MHEMTANVKRVAMVAMAGFAILSLHIAYWQVYRAPGLRADEHNTRARDRMQKMQPGDMVDRNGTPLLTSRRTSKGWERVYPEGRDVCHLTGYNDRSGLQPAMRDAFWGVGEYEKPWSEFLEGLSAGNTVRLTVDLDAQRLATQLMRGQTGAVVALDARDGAILATVSSPGYDPESVLENKWEFEIFREDPASPELNRVLQGRYPPGSVMKILSAAAAIDLGRVSPETDFECDGDYVVDGNEITCPRAHGTVTLARALEVSCNCAFTQLGEYIGGADYRDYVKRFHLLDSGALQLPSVTGGMGELEGEDAEAMLAATVFGQGATVITPLAIARMTLTIANGGLAVQPYIVAAVEDAGGSVVASGSGRELGRAISASTAATVAGMMVGVVEDGTAQDASLRSVQVAAKTGSAQNPAGEPHAWFTAFAPAKDPRVVVTVIVEHGGSGAEAALPIARRLMRQLLSAE